MSSPSSDWTGARSPTRIDLAGGTLDLWPLYLFVGEAVTVNFAIDVFTECSVRARPDGQVHLQSLDHQCSDSFESLTDFLANADSRWTLVREHLNHWRESIESTGHGLEIRTSSQSPTGGGLGGSSSLSISMLRALSRYLDQPLPMSKMAPLAGNLEARVLNTPTGCQDYYPAIHGGLNIIHLRREGTEVEILPAPEQLAERFFVVHTGHPHHSGMNNWSIMQAAVAKEEPVMKALHRLKEVAEQVERVCRKKDWDSLGPLLNEEYAARIELSPAVLCPEILRLKDLATEGGAEALKICGAGGGGCVIVWSTPEKQPSLKELCQGAGFSVLPTKPVVADPERWM